MSDRKAFDEAIANMSMVTSPYFKDYVFYISRSKKQRWIRQ